MKIRIMTYNIHSGKDINDKFSLNRIAYTIKESKADIIGLNEVIQNMIGFTKIYPKLASNQGAWLAKEVKYHYSFGRNLHLGLLNYFGNALLSIYPIVKTSNHLLRGKKEQRGCLRAEVLTPNGIVHILAVHLGLSKYDRQVQIEDILNILDKLKGPKILMGDFNTVNKEELVLFESKLTNIEFDESTEVQGTFPVNNPTKKIDFIFCSNEFKVVSSYTLPSKASDHLPIIAELELN